MFHDTIPEEREERHKPLIGMLRRGPHEPVSLSSSEQSEIIERVRERLALVGADLSRPQGKSNVGGNSETDVIMDFAKGMGQAQVQTGTALSLVPGCASAHPYKGSRPSSVSGVKVHKRSLPHLVNGLAAVLVVGILIGASFFLFRASPRQDISSPQIGSTGSTASTEVNGLRATIHLVTAGPYFLSELVEVDVSLRNSTHAPLRVDGSGKPDIACYSSALSVQISGGSAPFYSLPRLEIVCPQPMFLITVAPGETVAMRYYLPVTKSGEVTIIMGGMGEISGIPHTGPLAGHWPSLHIHVDPQVPANRVISLHEQGAQVIIEAPPAARTHLLYRETMSCDKYLGEGKGLIDWSQLSTTTLSQPACPTAHKHWIYIVSAVGYSTAAGKHDS